MWSPGEILVVDETVLSWEGVGEGHLTFCGRKPHPWGYMIKTIVDWATKILLGFDIVEG